MIRTLTANNKQLLASFDRISTVYIKQYGTGNLRLSGDPNELDSTVGAVLQDGIAQNAGSGFVQYFWDGDLWVISDQNGSIVVIIPTQQFYINRGNQKQPNGQAQPLAARGGLSTYEG